MLRRFPKQFIYLLILIIPFGLLFFNSSFWHKTKMGAMSVGTASIAVVQWPVKEVRKLLTYRQIWDEYQVLKCEVDSLKSRLSGMDEVSKENLRYSRLLKLKKTAMFSSEAALVIARAPSSWNSALMINKGVKDGIEPGMAVINALGVVGKVAEVADETSKVILMQDPGFKIAVVNQRSRESALVSGSLSGRCRLDYLRSGADIKQGDDLVTSPLSSSFPSGLLVGKVSQVYTDDQGQVNGAVVMPFVDVSKVEEVLVIK